ncbi:MAG TPA: M23 family peptidase, partial [Burkholderiales bacterium]|nr:M23 family peptidase [Burkholderiales bacterium]
MQQDNGLILTQKPSGLLSGSRFWRLALVLVLPFIGVVAAFGIAPDTATETVARTEVVKEILLPLSPLASKADDGYWREERIQRGDTIATLLERLGTEDPAAAEFLRNTRSARTLRQLIPGRTVRALATAKGSLLALRYQTGGTVLNVQRQDESFQVTEQPVEFERRVLLKTGEISSSLFAATDAAGLPDAVAIQIADIFSTDIDFHRDLRRGDRFAVVYEIFYDQGEP